MGAGHGVGLPRDHPGLPRRRDRAARHRPDDRRVRRRRDRRAARRRLPHRHGRRARRPRRPRDPAEPTAFSARRRRSRARSPTRVVQSLPLDAAAANTIPWRRAEIPAAGGFGNARSVAMIHAPMACGGEANGVRLLSPTGADPCSTSRRTAQDLVLPSKLRHGIGFGLPSPDMPISPNPRACFWGGWGGSLAVIDLDARMTFAYVMNKMGEGTTGDLRGASHPRRALRATLGRLTSACPASGPVRTASGVGLGPGDEVVGAPRVDDPLDRDVDTWPPGRSRGAATPAGRWRGRRCRSRTSSRRRSPARAARTAGRDVRAAS